jgi:hypothetical protein
MRETRARKNAFNGMNCAINAPQMQPEPVDVELNMISAEIPSATAVGPHDTKPNKHMCDIENINIAVQSLAERSTKLVWRRWTFLTSRLERIDIFQPGREWS